jgi:hypothetical protein
MQWRRPVVAMAATAVVAAFCCLPPAPAAADMPVTLVLLGGSLTISQPGSATLGTATVSASGTTVTGKLGSTTITDTRGTLAGWTVTISATNLSDGASPTPHTIAAGNMRAYVAAIDGPTVTSGVAVPTTPYTSLATALTLSTGGHTFVTTTATGSNTVTYNPTVSVTVGSSAVAATYAGTVTQTAA